jgi:dihydrofolate reductase
MGSVTVINHLTLDGVMQAPAAPDEDPRDGFAHGGWAVPYGDSVMAEVMGKGMQGEGSLLFGRRTYEHFYDVWPKRTDGNPFTEVLNHRQKYVASTTLTEPLPWVNSTLLSGDAADAVAALKAEGDLGILGSGVLVQSLLARGLIDAFLLTIHPLVLGSGRRLFGDDGAFAKLTLVDVTPTTTGVLIAGYEVTR